MSPRVFVSTPDLRPSLLSILEGLASSGLLAGLATTISLSPRLIERLSNVPVAGRWLAPRLRRNEVPAFLTDKVDNIWCREVVRRVSSRIAASTVTHGVWEWGETNFDRIVADRYGGRFDIIYGMEHSSARTFAAQKASGGGCVLRQVNAHARTLNAMLRRECARFPDLVTPYHRMLMTNDEKVARRKEAEYDLADLIVANSEYVRKTFIENGVPAAKVIAVPTGCPPLDPVGARSGAGSDALRVLYVGAMTLRKGFPYLLDAWNRLAPRARAQLWIAGGSQLNLGRVLKDEPSIRYLGVLSKDGLRDVYRQADILVLPTLCEGLAHVVLEGVSFGLPVITTEASGAGDLVRHGENGLIVPEGDADALASALERAIVQRSSLPVMGARSAEQAKGWTIADSNAAHLRAVQDLLAARGL
jgi:glycosyltransferase involved in cell wall biosynthesis